LSFVIAILTVVLVAVAVLVISAPLRSARRWRKGGSPPAAGSGAGRDRDGLGESSSGPPDGVEATATRLELEAAREAKYREIRDAELDYRTGKLSREDYEAIDRELRDEAIEILNRLEADED
jgi:hypothetical protein